MRWALGLLAVLPLYADVSLTGARFRGQVWIADQGAGRVFALDRAGREVWSINNLGQVRDFDLKANGNILTGGLEGKVREFDRHGRQLWEHQARDGVYSVRYLPNGNLLIAEYKSVVELTYDRRIVWEYAGECPEDLHVLPNGRYLIAWYGVSKVEEVDRDKKVHWKLDIDGPMGAQRLKNDRTLVAPVRTQSIRIVDRDGNLAWEHSLGANTPHASMTRSGDVLVSTWKSIRRISPAHKVVWTYDKVSLAIKVREY